jgi:hypothetical protein
MKENSLLTNPAQALRHGNEGQSLEDVLLDPIAEAMRLRRWRIFRAE